DGVVTFSGDIFESEVNQVLITIIGDGHHDVLITRSNVSRVFASFVLGYSNHWVQQYNAGIPGWVDTFGGFEDLVFVVRSHRIDTKSDGSGRCPELRAAFVS